MNPRRNSFIVGLIPVSLLIFLLIALELFFRGIYPSAENSLVTEVTYDGIKWYQTNRSFLKKYFPANSPTTPEFKPVLFKKEKNKGLFRIMCLGESSMFGTPYEMTANIPAILRKQLRHLFPEVEFEVINLGASAINSNVILDVDKRLPEFQPDLVIIYMGHNEFYGPDGVGASFLEKWFPSLTQLKYKFRELRTVQILQSWLSRSSPKGEEMNLMKQVSEGNRVRLHSEDADRVLRNFERNLTETVEILKKNNIAVIVSDVSSNLLFPPFVSDSLPAGSPEGLASVFPGRMELQGDTVSVLKELASAFAHDTTNAWVNYWMGRFLLGTGQSTEARRHLLLARDNDLLKFRAPEVINKTIRIVCEKSGVPFISADSTLCSLSQHFITGDTLFWEHLHPTACGYSIIAEVFLKEILRSPWEFNPRNRVVAPLLPFNYDSLSICWLDLAYADLSIQHLTGRWPFTDYHRSPVVLLPETDNALRQIAKDVYERKIAWDEGCYKSAAVFWRKGLLSEALTTYQAELEINPYNFYAQYLTGSLLNNMGDQANAVDHYSRSIRSNPAYPNSRLDLGLLKVNQGNFDAGIAELDTVLMLTENSDTSLRATAHYGLAAAYANKNDLTRALANIDLALHLIPRYNDALELRNKILRR